MCTEIFSDEQVTEFILGKFLVPLARDRVVNVRVTVGKVISKLFKHKSKQIF